MAYIYKIINDINNKIYIGKTEQTPEKRFKQHCKDAFKERNEKRPLYAAMRKYGIKHFHYETIEQTDNPEEREIYWIEYFSSFKNGYNATLGGDGKHYIDYDVVVATYRELKSEKDTAEKMQIDVSSVRKILQAKQEPIISSKEVVQNKYGKIVNQYDLNNIYIATFPSIKMAAKSLGKITSTSNGAVGHISDVCKGKRKTAYGYIWRFAN